MKRFISEILACALVMGTCACTSGEKNVKDGTFSGSGKGYGGNIVADVTFSNGVITKIDIQEENETKTWSASALENIPKYIMSAQSINTDTITGATVTSVAIQDAVSAAIQQAHGDINEWKEDATGKHAAKEVDKETDVVIVGGGLSGMTAALRLRQLGKRCMLVEKNSVLGGALYYGGSYSQLYADEEVKNSAFSGGDTVFSSLMDAYLADTVDWQKKDLGVLFEDEGSVRNYAQENTNIGELLSREAEVSGAEVLLDTCVTGITKEGNSVTGVDAIDKDGKIYHIHANDVILASGSASSLYTYNSDDLFTITKELGYQVNDYQNTEARACVDLENGEIVDTYYAIQKAMNSPMVLVNQSGERIVLSQSSRLGLNAALGDTAYLVMDASAYKKWKAGLLESVDEEMRDTLSVDTFKSVFHFDTLEKTCRQAGVDYANLQETLHSYNEVATDVFGREIKVGFDEDADITIVKLCSGTYEHAGGIVIDDNLNVIDQQGNPVENVYAIGNCADAVVDESEGSENAWAFVSGKRVADILGEE